MKSCRLLFFLACCVPLAAHAVDDTYAGPEKGFLFIHGGGKVTEEEKKRFVELAGGSTANVVLITTAMPEKEVTDQGYKKGQGRGWAKLWGINKVTMLDIRDKEHANSQSISDIFRKATGVWIMGGRQWRLVDAYLGTSVEREIKALIQRGGVVGGSSAGATIQGSYLVRGSSGTESNPNGNRNIMMAPGYETGFGLLPNSAIDQHINTRHREHDLDSVINVHPELLGIGIDEGAAIIVHGDFFSVMGGSVIIHKKNKNGSIGNETLTSGQIFNLKTRKRNSSAKNFIRGSAVNIKSLKDCSIDLYSKIPIIYIGEISTNRFYCANSDLPKGN